MKSIKPIKTKTTITPTKSAIKPMVKTSMTPTAKPMKPSTQPIKSTIRASLKQLGKMSVQDYIQTKNQENSMNLKK